MSESIADILNRLDQFADYDGPWTLLTRESPLLHERLKELRQRETRLDDVLIVALVGGSGVGKSTLLNALAGDELAPTSEFRPCTSAPTVYHPPGARLDFKTEWKSVTGSALERLVVVDTPDSDTIVREHRQIVIEVLKQCDLILICADSEKYLDEATWSLVRPLRNERTMVCVETKASRAPSVREDWLSRLRENGIESAGYFRVDSRRTFDRKVSGQLAGEDEYDFSRLEDFLQKELTADCIRRIKRSNAAGLLIKTIGALKERVTVASPRLKDIEKALNEADTELAKESFEVVNSRLFAESHLWTYALGREMSLRSKGVVGTLFRVLEAVRTIPARMANWGPLRLRGGAGKRAASLLTDKALLEEGLELSSVRLKDRYLSERSELSLLLAKSGFTPHESEDGFATFTAELNRRIGEVLRGPARDRIVRRARVLTSWPVTIVQDAPPVAFMGISGYNVVAEFIQAEIFGAGFFLHAGTVLAIILGGELFAVSTLVHLSAWSARRSAVSDLRVALVGNRLAFETERTALREAEAMVAEIESLYAAVTGDAPERVLLKLVDTRAAAS